MHGLVLFLHFFGLMIGATGGFGSGFIMFQANKAPPEQAKILRAQGRPLAMVAATGLVILWITGILMMIAGGGPGAMPAAFWWKIAFVVIATVLMGLTHRTYAQIGRTGNYALAERLKTIGPATGVSVLLAVLLAAYAFN
jgi:hypothetical protein